MPGYTLTVDGYTMKNTLKSGSVTLNKTDRQNKPMEGVTFILFTEDGKPVKSSVNGTKYKYSGFPTRRTTRYIPQTRTVRSLSRIFLAANTTFGK